MLARRSLLIALALLVPATGLFLVVGRVGRGDRAEASCPPGFTSAAQRERMHARELRYEAMARDAGRGHGGEAGARGDEQGERGGGCQPLKHPESPADIAAVNAFRSARVTAPATAVKPGAYANAIGERAALARA